jgi:hypothetical protein
VKGDAQIAGYCSEALNYRTTSKSLRVFPESLP